MLCGAKVCYEDTAKPYRKQYQKTSTGVKEWLRLRRDVYRNYCCIFISSMVAIKHVLFFSNYNGRKYSLL